MKKTAMMRMANRSSTTARVSRKARSAEGSDVPIQVIAGRHDPALGAETVRATFGAWYPNLELEIFPDAGHYARYNASAPIAASSALKNRHRLNPRGNRQLNAALHVND